MGNVPEIRYDLGTEADRLDLTSHEQLIGLALKWSDQNNQLAAEVLDLEPFEHPGEWRCLQLPAESPRFAYATTISIRK